MRLIMVSGKFIMFEGIDGVGKIIYLVWFCECF